MAKHKATFADPPRGFSLIEAMIALLVLSIGLIGIASLNLSAVRSAHSSYYSSIASSAALDLEERLWLALSELDSDCVTTAMINGVISEMENDWGSGTSGLVSIPGLQVNLESAADGKFDDETENDAWTEVGVKFRWTDGRFTEIDPDNPALNEGFQYTARVLCALPPEPEEGTGS